MLGDPYAQPFEDEADDEAPAVVGFSDDAPTIEPFEDMNYFDGDEGTVNSDEGVEGGQIPAGWNQHPGEFDGDNRPTIRWGDVKSINIPANPAGGLVLDAVLQVLDFYLQIPAVCMVRLSAQELTGVAVAPTDLITWTLLIGVGSSTQTRKYQKKLSPNDGTADNDFFLTMPLEHLVATATVQCNADPTKNRMIEVSAQVAPFTSAPWMAR
jgi:hypothetical protein